MTGTANHTDLRPFGTLVSMGRKTITASANKDTHMTDLPPMQYLDEAARLFHYQEWKHVGSFRDQIIAHARALQRIAELEAKLPKDTLADVARREAYKLNDVCVGSFCMGFLRAAEMAKKGELPDE